jgi:hypothetical protein
VVIKEKSQLIKKQSELIYQDNNKLKINELYNEWKKKLDKMVYDNDLIKLKNDYFGTNTYYYDHKHSRMYKIHPCGCHSERNANSILSFDTDDDNHVLELNNIKSSPLNQKKLFPNKVLYKLMLILCMYIHQEIGMS